jgi:hypothetical protein
MILHPQVRDLVDDDEEEPDEVKMRIEAATKWLERSRI